MKTSSFSTQIRSRAEVVGLPIDADLVERLEQYWTLLARWNARVGLTGLPLRDLPDRSLDRLLIEPLVAATFVDAGPLNWFDFGSGGGSPAIPLKIASPRAQLTLVESKVKKAAFLREALRHLQFSDAAVFCGRVEELPDRQSSSIVDLVTVRAVRIDSGLLKVASLLLGPSGKLLLLASSATAGQRSSSFVAAGFQLMTQVTLPTPGAVLQVLTKLGV